MALDAPLFDKALPGEVSNVAFHLRAVAVIGEAGKVVGRYHAKLAQVGERTNFGIAQRVFPVPPAKDRSRAVKATIGPCRIWFPVAVWLTVRTAPVWRVAAPFDQIAGGPFAPSERECEVGNAIRMVHGETPFVSPWRGNEERLRATCKEKGPVQWAATHRLALAEG